MQGAECQAARVHDAGVRASCTAHPPGEFRRPHTSRGHEACRSELSTAASRRASCAQPETLAKLISYLVEMPADDDTHNRQFKYPFVASEVLASDVPSVRDALLAPERALVQPLLALLSQPPPLPTVLAGYCSKVIVALYKGNSEQFLAYFAALWEAEPSSPLALPSLIPAIMQHLGSDSVLCMLVALCAGEPPSSEPCAGAALLGPAPDATCPPPASWLPHARLVPALLTTLDNDDGEVRLRTPHPPSTPTHHNHRHHPSSPPPNAHWHSPPSTAQAPRPRCRWHSTRRRCSAASSTRRPAYPPRSTSQRTLLATAATFSSRAASAPARPAPR